ncbi:MAG: hypothetical protein GF381_04335 [Candidatus Pacebacteria bacterium]|nr:hypothetical protein [Candidatus Paceibacterota bacterium]
MSIATSLLTQVADELAIPYSLVGNNCSFVRLELPLHDHYLINTHLGLVSDADQRIARDKAYHYQLLKDVVAMPVTRSYLDPATRYQQDLKFDSVDKIVADIQSNLTLPLIIKKNRGQEGVYVFKVDRPEEIEDRVRLIFNQQKKDYDYLLLAQEYIKPKHEYRVIAYQQRVYIAYLKDISQAKFQGNLSPTHWQGVKIREAGFDKTKQLEKFVSQVFSAWPVSYLGFDIVEDKEGKLWLIEVNSAPGVAKFIKAVGPGPILKMYRDILVDLKDKHSL